MRCHRAAPESIYLIGSWINLLDHLISKLDHLRVDISAWLIIYKQSTTVPKFVSKKLLIPHTHCQILNFLVNGGRVGMLVYIVHRNPDWALHGSLQRMKTFSNLWRGHRVKERARRLTTHRCKLLKTMMTDFWTLEDRNALKQIPYRARSMVAHPENRSPRFLHTPLLLGQTRFSTLHFLTAIVQLVSQSTVNTLQTVLSYKFIWSKQQQPSYSPYLCFPPSLSSLHLLHLLSQVRPHWLNLNCSTNKTP